VYFFKEYIVFVYNNKITNFMVWMVCCMFNVPQESRMDL
jgi:hypothetical protein